MMVSADQSSKSSEGPRPHRRMRFPWRPLRECCPAKNARKSAAKRGALRQGICRTFIRPAPSAYFYFSCRNSSVMNSSSATMFPLKAHAPHSPRLKNM